MAILFNARTDVGRVRGQNEDNFLVDRKLQLYVVCDGMGGHASGEVASATAVNVVREVLVQNRHVLDAYKSGDSSADAKSVNDLLERAVLTASKRIWERGQLNPEQRGMGTTCSLLLILGRRGFIAHVGDSRLYRLRDDEVVLITEDHSLYNAMLKAGTIPDENDPRMSHIRNAVTRAVGVQDSVEVDSFDIELVPGDRYLVCSDGLHGYWEGVEVNPLDFISEPDLAVAVENMIEFANSAGGKDNITAILIELPADHTFGDEMGSARNDDVLRRTALAKGLNSRERRTLASRLREKQLQPAEVLAMPDSPADGLWIVADGALEAVAQSGSRRLLRPGDIIGETALLSGATHGIRIACGATGPARLLFLSRQEIRRLTTEAPGLQARLMTNIAVRQSGRLVAASQALDDGIWRYGFPEAKPRSEAPKRTPAVTTAELPALPREAVEEDIERGPALEVATPRKSGPRPDGRSDTMPNIPRVSAARPSEVDFDVSMDVEIEDEYALALAQMTTADNEDALAPTIDIAEAKGEDTP